MQKLAPGSKPSAPQPPVFDYAALSKRLMDDEDLIRIVAEAFIADMSEQLELLKKSVLDEDLPLVAAQLHKIKGASANVGGMALSATILPMEQACKAGDIKTAAQMLPELERCFTLLKTAIEKIL